MKLQSLMLKLAQRCVFYGMDPTAPKVLCEYDGAYNAWSAARKLTRIHKEVCDEFGKETYKRYGVSRSLDISI